MVTTSPMYRSTLASTAARAWRAAAVVVAVVAFLPAGASAAPAPLFTFRDPQIAESSGIVASATRDDVFFTHNDSGDTARFFAVDHYGCTIGVFTAPGVMATDWEDIARGPGNSLWIGDIGDNNAMRNEIAVHRFDEPAVAALPMAADARPQSSRWSHQRRIACVSRTARTTPRRCSSIHARRRSSSSRRASRPARCTRRRTR